MALIDCPECGHRISDKAQSCPNCGYDMVAHFQEIAAKERLIRLVEVQDNRRNRNWKLQRNKILNNFRNYQPYGW